MKTRIINTKLYRDKNFRELTDKNKYIVIYILTNEYLEALPVVEIELGLLAYHCQATKQYLEELLPKLRYYGIGYKHGCLFVTDKFTYANYKGGKTANVKIKQYESLPDEVKQYVNPAGVIGQWLGNDCSMIEHINHKTKTINNKSETINHKSETINNKFNKPSIEEIKKYCIVRKNNINPLKFYNYYESNGWKVGKNAMKNWKATIKTWEQNTNSHKNQSETVVKQKVDRIEDITANSQKMDRIKQLRIDFYNKKYGKDNWVLLKPMNNRDSRHLIDKSDIAEFQKFMKNKKT